jgi:hypothetical protein
VELRRQLLANAAKRKDGFVQLFLMAGVFMMSLRPLAQKDRLRALRARDLQNALRREANDADSSGAPASHFRRIFAVHPAPAASAKDQ